MEREAQHAEVPIIHLIVRRLIDRSDMLDALPQAEGSTAWAERTLGRADEVRRPDPGARTPRKARLPASRDFR